MKYSPCRALPLLLATLLFAGCARPDPAERGAFAAAGLDGSRSLPSAVLPSATGEPYALAERTAGKVTLLFVGYTFCPDVCPVHMSSLAAILRDLPFTTSREIETIFVTADPDRDTPERLREWIGAIEPRFVALRPDAEELRALEESLGLPHSGFTRLPGEDDYLVGHAAQVIGFDRAGVARAAWPWGTLQRDWKRDLPRIVEGEWPEPSDFEITSSMEND
jgi:protein SCO1/2